MAILSDRSLPRWLGWLAILAAVAAVIGVVAILAHFTTEFGGAVAAASPLALLFCLVWVVGLSVHMARSPAGAGPIRN